MSPNLYTKLLPILPVRDLKSEVDFYTKLGFEKSSHDKYFASLSYGDRILFGLHQSGQVRSEAINWQIGTRDILALRRLCKSAGMTMIGDVNTNEYGYRELKVRTPNGYLLTFEEDVD